MAALYRKYRPQVFEDVVGQEAVVRTLTNALNTGQIRQAYLFAGPRGTGKTSMARILAKSLNCAVGPSARPDGTCHSCVAIAAGTSIDVVEMDAASQRGIDDIREIRDRVMLQPVEGQYKVYILDEAHQLTDAAWNALLKLIEEPPPHLVFVFCTTELQKVLPTVRSRCQTFAFQRPRLPDLLKLLRRVADGEEMQVPDAALALIARSARGSFRDAVSTLDQVSAATAGTTTVPDVLQLLGAVEDEVLFRLCDYVVEANPEGALMFLEELSEQGQDLGRLVTELLEHLRQLMLVQHMGEAPASLPVTDETRERLREQAHQLSPATVVRLIDLLHVATEDMRQGGDPRLPLELALVKVTRPGSDLSRESTAYRLEQLEQGTHVAPRPEQPTPPETAARPEPRAPGVSEAQPPAAEAPAPAPETVTQPASVVAAPAPPNIDLAQLQENWRHTVVAAVGARSIPAGSFLVDSHPVLLEADTLTIEFPRTAEFMAKQAEDEKNAAFLKEALHEVTGRRLALVFTLGEGGGGKAAVEDEGPLTEEQLIATMKSTLDAREVEG